MSIVRVVDVIAVMEQRYPIASAEEWDSVGLVVGNPESEVNKVLFTVDPTKEVVDEAIRIGAEMIIAHHPLLLRGVTSVADTNAKGRIINSLIRNNISLFTAHTNADVARPGVTDAMATTFGIALDQDSSLSINGIGRIGSLPTVTSLGKFANVIKAGLPATARAINILGDKDRLIRRVAVCGGAGDSLLDSVAQTDADVYVTSDLRHHVAQEFAANSNCALIDIPHWSGEWLWLGQAADLLVADLDGNVSVEVSAIVTDPWSFSL